MAVSVEMWECEACRHGMSSVFLRRELALAGHQPKLGPRTEGQGVSREDPGPPPLYGPVRGCAKILGLRHVRGFLRRNVPLAGRRPKLGPRNEGQVVSRRDPG